MVKSCIFRPCEEEFWLITEGCCITAELTQLTAEVRCLTAEPTRLTAEIRRLTAELTRLTAEIRRLTAELTQLTAEVRRLTAEPTRLTAEIRHLTAELTRLTAGLPRLTAIALTIHQAQLVYLNEKNWLKPNLELQPIDFTRIDKFALHHYYFLNKFMTPRTIPPKNRGSLNV